MTLDHDPFIDPDRPTIMEAYDPRLDSVGCISNAVVRGPSRTLIINELHSLTTDMADMMHDYNFHQVWHLTLSFPVSTYT